MVLPPFSVSLVTISFGKHIRVIYFLLTVSQSSASLHTNKVHKNYFLKYSFLETAQFGLNSRKNYKKCYDFFNVLSLLLHFYCTIGLEFNELSFIDRERIVWCNALRELNTNNCKAWQQSKHFLRA